MKQIWFYLLESWKQVMTILIHQWLSQWLLIKQVNINTQTTFAMESIKFAAETAGDRRGLA